MSVAAVTTERSEDRIAELDPPLAGCNTRERWSHPLAPAALEPAGPCTSLSSLTADYINTGAGELSLRCESGRTGPVPPSPSLTCSGMDKGKMPSPLHPLTI